MKKNKIYLMDCIIGLKKIKKNSVDLIITDPPYFLENFKNNWDTEKNKNKAKGSRLIKNIPAGMKFDRKQSYELEKFYSLISNQAFRILKPGGFFITFSSDRLYHRMAVAVEDSGFEIRNMFSWGRNTMLKAFSLNYFIDKNARLSLKQKEDLKSDLKGWKTPQLNSFFEPAVFAQKPKEGTYIENWLKWKVGLVNTNILWEGKKIPNHIFVKKTKEDKFNHMTIKPLRLIEYLIKITTKENDIVLDPFIGSGTTAVACINLKRNYIGFEIDEEYIQIAKNRINQKHEKTNPFWNNRIKKTNKR